MFSMFRRVTVVTLSTPPVRRNFNGVGSRVLLSSTKTTSTATGGASELGLRTTSSYGVTMAFIAGIGVSAMAYFNAFKVPKPENDVDFLLRAFEEGRGLENLREHVVDVDRTKLESQLSAIMQRPVLKKYVVVVGNDGTGKSTVIKGALSALPSPKGAIYIHCPLFAEMFSIDLAVLLGFWSRPKNIACGSRGPTRTEKSSTT